MITISLDPVIPGYKISSQLYAGSRTRVYRAIREQDTLAVVIKLLASEYPSFNELLQFRNQYTISKNLNLDGIVRPLLLEAYRNGYILVMEDKGEISLREYIKTTTLSLVEFLATAIQLTNILHDLHQNRVIHKDIKPANILIHPQTKQVKLIDFSIASLLPKETQEIKSPNILEGTLAYISPEQTGRMNRGIDYRSDFYSLGVTFYELLTGELPFTSNDPMELVHSHIAIMPSGLGNGEKTPEVLSDIVMKLMAKNAEDRYQSALGLKYDLENCLYQLKETGKIIYFEIAQRDVRDRFLIPEKLYGREKKVATLLEAFERVANGTSDTLCYARRAEMMLVAGFSGIGKTAVVNEVHKPITRQQGYFIKGKFDQFNRNIPLSAFVQAFRDLMGQLLSESDAQLATWRTKIIAAVGVQGQVIVEVIPELERIIGQQPLVPELSGSAAQNRFNLLFQKFIQVFTTKEHPLVMFLDDLQWADSASLNLLQLLMGEAGCGYLLNLGAYRDNEVFPAHPLMLTLEHIQKAGAVVNTITLEPLGEITVNQLLADTLNCTEELAQPLTRLVYQKTKGNPFFTTQFLKALHEDGWIKFQFDLGYWQCDMAAVRQLALTDDVVEFMALQLQKLSVETQAVLKLAACIGNQFDLNTLAIISEQSAVDAASNLWKALQEGLILPESQVYKFYLNHDEADANTNKIENLAYRFLHDRVQQAAYSLIADNQKQATHLKIGQLLLKKIPATERDKKIFDIVNQLNYGVQIITELAEQEELAWLNLSAGSKARASTAYTAATEYATFGIKLLKVDCWRQYQLALELHNLGAEAAYLAGNFELMAEFIQKVLDCVSDPLDKIKVHEVQIQAYGAQNKAKEAVQLGKEILKLLGVEFPENISSSDIQAELNQIASLLADKPIEDLINLPLMTDKKCLAAMRILSNITTLAYQAAPDLYPLVPLKQVSLSLQYGNSPQSAFGYVGYGIILCGLVEDIESGYRFGQLSIELLSHFDTKEVTSKVMNGFNCLVRHWKEHTRETVQSLWEGYSIGLETGDLEFAGINIRYYNTHLYFLGQELNTLAEEMRTYTQALQLLKQERIAHHNEIQRQRILNLLGEVDDVCCLKGEAYDEEVMLPISIESNDMFALLEFYFTKFQLSYLFGKYELARGYAAQLEQYAPGGLAMVISRQCNFYMSLANLGIFLEVDQDTQTQLLKQVIDNQEKMQLWANHCPINVLHQYYLVEAEKYRVLNKNYEAGDLYDHAIAKAKENSYILEEALASELAAKFYLNLGKEKIAAGYMQEAYYCYARWGAKAKTDDLEQHYPHLLRPILQPVTQQSLNSLETLASIANISIHGSTKTSRSSSTSINTILDFTTIIKASQSLSSTIQLDKLIHQLTQILLQHSGGNRCVLIMPNQVGELQIVANATPNIVELRSEPLKGSNKLPVKLIQYVKNTQKVVMIDDLKTDLPIIDDYLIQRRPKSVLCLPILNQGQLIGILYLKNLTTSGVFTSDRILSLNFLCTQAAISLENARLYQQAQTYAQQLEQSQLQIIQSEKMASLGNLVAGVAHEINNPIGFLNGSINNAKEYVQDLLDYLTLYQQYHPDAAAPVQDKAEEIDLEFLSEDLLRLLDSMEGATERIKGISTSLRTFSRADTENKVSTNIHDGIDSTLLILKYRLKANDFRPAIQVTQDYGQLSLIKCFPGQLNQVFMNILANAIDMFDEMAKTQPPQEITACPQQITIHTAMVENQVQIRIRDNGKGMTEDVKARIFDHLFTTKPVGKGTGLGLAIAQQIVVEKHGGRLNVQSEVGRGTEFLIQLPI
ncbi:serine/threonine protein kinase [Dulcicalothrix desertica PCC 7102]|uniref:histidine kinase n=1 Tax=Dulcicalothrix desertica PCC 7102 TaxID=232991 RepID=A0A433VS84_9CYAN|nr:ATP-binding sensor histidine kinase [Dulcicalothrix desertica]RUT08862.1 serine/threonine protein kinase [Dulcicalothrix desertica PCC 7102]TWH44122.1 putative ATPase [Dulcicalothrix desertica PCC 7102]